GSVGANYTVTWFGKTVPPADSSGVHNEILTVLKAGAYQALVTDDDTGCISSKDNKNIIDSFTYPVINIVPTDQTSCDVNNPNGKLDASTTTPAGVTFTWYDGTGAPPAVANPVHAQTGANTGIIDKLQATSVSPFLSYTVKAVIPSTGCSSAQTENVVNNVVHPVVNLVNSQQVTTCGNSPNGEATTTITGLLGAPAFVSIKYDLFYVYTKKGGTYPTDSLTLVTSGDSNNTPNATSLPAAPSYTGMAPGYLTAYVIDKNTLCTSPINTVQIIDATQSYSFTINAKAKAGLCAAVNPGGGIDVTVERSDNPGVNCATCTFKWYNATPINPAVPPINFFDNPPNMGAAVALTAPLVNNEDLGDTSPSTNPPGVGAGTYTLVVLDNDPAHKDCGNYLTDFVPPSSLPTVDTTLTHISKCNSPNGQIDVKVSGGTSALGYTIKIFQGTNNTGTKLAELAIPNTTALLSSNPNSLPTSPFLDQGDYYIEAVDNDAVNIACP
ncbi:MAG TPA: hypothetical protein VJ508_15705, partial [Saprospiraceae bacterium]|nr:hypothetical protein [Saprospiraceae bacterium]